MRRIVIIGATSTIAEHCARLWVREPTDLILVARNQRKLDSIARDLKVRSQRSNIVTRMAVFEDPKEIELLVCELCSTAVDIVLIAHGSMSDQKDCQDNLSINKHMLEINGVSPVLFAEAFANHMERYNKGTLAIIGSVAGDRGRKSNYVYGAAKGLISRYAEGLQHRLVNTNVKIVLIKPGPTDTPMTSNLKAIGKKMENPKSVAIRIIKKIDQGVNVVYAPAKWKLIMMLIRHIPRGIFNKLNI